MIFQNPERSKEEEAREQEKQTPNIIMPHSYPHRKPQSEAKKFTFYRNKRGNLIKTRFINNEPKLRFKPSHRDPTERKLRKDRRFKFDQIQEWILCSFYETVGGRYQKNIIQLLVKNMRKNKCIFWQQEFQESTFRNTIVSNLCRRWTKRRKERILFGGDPSKTRKNADLVMWTLYDNGFKNKTDENAIIKTMEQFNKKHQSINRAHIDQIIMKSYPPAVFRKELEDEFEEGLLLDLLCKKNDVDAIFESYCIIMKCYKRAMTFESYEHQFATISFESFIRLAYQMGREKKEEEDQEKDDEDFWNEINNT